MKVHAPVPVSQYTIGVMGSGSDTHNEIAAQVGEVLASLEVNLLTGAGGGVMTSVSRAFTAAPRKRGICIGIVPCCDEDHRHVAKNGYPNPYIELPIYTHLPYSADRGQHDLSRNHINILSSTAIIALPGGEGTRSEVELAVKYEKPVIAFASDETQLKTYHHAVKKITDIADVKKFLMSKAGK